MSMDHDFDGQQHPTTTCGRCSTGMVKDEDFYWWAKRPGMPVRAACSEVCCDAIEVEWMMGGGKAGYRKRQL